MLEFALLKANEFKYGLTDKHVLKGLAQSQLWLMQAGFLLKIQVFYLHPLPLLKFTSVLLDKGWGKMN